MALRRLGTDAAAHLRRGVPDARTFAAYSCGAPVAGPARDFLSLHGLQSVWSRYSSLGPAFQAKAPMFGALLTARIPPGVRPKLPGLLKGFGTGGAVLAVMLYPKHVAHATEDRFSQRPSDDIIALSNSEYSKQVLGELWNFVRKFQLPLGLILLVVYGWRKPIVLIINVLLLLYSSRPDPYSIYLFLQEIHQKKVRQNPALWKEEFLQTRKVDTEDYKFFSIGTVELKDGTVLHAFGVLGGWWMYHVSYVKRNERMKHNFSFSRLLSNNGHGSEFICDIGQFCYAGTRDMGGRNIGVAVDFSSCSKAALQWVSSNLTRNGDKVILIHVNNSYQNEQGAMHLWEQSGSPLIPLAEFSNPHVTKTYGLSPDKGTLEILAQVANQRGVEVFGKILYGDPTKKLCESVEQIPLSCLIIGSRGLSTLKRALMGSVSTYVVNHATCPVTVVKENI